MHSSFSARAPKSQLAFEQPSTGRHWNLPQKDTPYPRTKKKPHVKFKNKIKFKKKKKRRSHKEMVGVAQSQ